MYILTNNETMNQELLENIVIQAVDSVAEKTDDLITRQLVDLLKCSILKKYKIIMNDELNQGWVNKTNIDKTVDYCFAEASIVYRQQQVGISDDVKEKEIAQMKNYLDTIKDVVKKMLETQGVKVVDIVN